MYSQEFLEHVRLIDHYKQDFDEFVPHLFHKGYRVVGYGENHSSWQLHRSVVDLIPRLVREVGLACVCLEIEDSNQSDIDSYFDTADETYLEQVIEREKQLVKRGLPVQGRVNTPDYFDIVRIASELGVRVIAMDKLSSTDRDTYMAKHIPDNGNILVYVGQGHLLSGTIDGGKPLGVTDCYQERRGGKTYRIGNIIAGESDDHVSQRLETLIVHGKISTGQKGFGLDLLGDKLFETLAFSEFVPVASYFDGVLYHK